MKKQKECIDGSKMYNTVFGSKLHEHTKKKKKHEMFSKILLTQLNNFLMNRLRT